MAIINFAIATNWLKDKKVRKEKNDNSDNK